MQSNITGSICIGFLNLGVKVKPAYELKRKIVEYHLVINLMCKGRLNFNCWLTCNV